MSETSQRVPLASALRIAEIQRKHGVRIKLRFRARHWECSVHRGITIDDYTGGASCQVGDLLERVALDLEREPTLRSFVRSFFGVEIASS